ncbi:MAG TPA: 2OG-Fe(II) oxygenase, partial [Vicinamibacteria bacterium]
RSRVDMGRHRFGMGEYRYFARPLPPLVDALRRQAYAPLAAIANGWMEALRAAERFPTAFEDFEARCVRAGQRQPTPLLLRYEAGGYNCLHQDLYGAVAFPMQIVVLLSRPGVDHEGGEFLLVQQRPRAQSIAEVIAGEQGEMVVFANRFWPGLGSRGFYRTNVRHGVSRVRAGTRFALGIIFHDAV